MKGKIETGKTVDEVGECGGKQEGLEGAHKK